MASNIRTIVINNNTIMANLESNSNVKAPKIKYLFECYGKDGNLKWSEEGENLVTTVGKNDILDKYFKGSAYSATWFIGLKGAGTEVVGDTLASHAGWAEITAYTGTRKAVTWGTVSAGSLTASSAGSFAITGTTTVAGAFLCNVTSGTSGILYSVEDFASPRSLASGDTLNVTPTVSMT